MTLIERLFCTNLPKTGMLSTRCQDFVMLGLGCMCIKDNSAELGFLRVTMDWISQTFVSVGASFIYRSHLGDKFIK